MSGLPVSVIICTLNRERILRSTLQSLAKVRISEKFQPELVIVDNGSADGTGEVARSALFAGLPARYVHEPRRGVGNARNRGLAEARGDILLFLDDDLWLPEGWLDAMCEPIMSGRADAVSCGLEMAPYLARPWMTLRHRGWLACVGQLWAGVPPEEVTLITASMAFSRRILQAVPAFDPELGCGALGFHEDALFSWQLSKAGFRPGFVDAVAEHHFDEKRLLRSNFVEAARRMGRSSAYIAWHWNHKKIRFPLLQSLIAASKLSLHRITRLRSSPDTEGCSELEMKLEQESAFFKRYLVEARRPRNYDLHGLVKTAGIR